VFTLEKSKKLINYLAKGHTQIEAAAKLGVAPITAHRWANREEIRQQIDAQAAKMVEMLPKSIRITESVLIAGEREAAKLQHGDDTADKSIVDMAIKVGDKIQQAVGIQASHAGSTVINNILIDNSQTVLLPQVQGLLDAIDITPDADSDTL
jgi:hypothetical protein